MIIEEDIAHIKATRTDLKRHNTWGTIANTLHLYFDKTPQLTMDGRAALTPLKKKRAKQTQLHSDLVLMGQMWVCRRGCAAMITDICQNSIHVLVFTYREYSRLSVKYIMKYLYLFTPMDRKCITSSLLVVRAH